MFNLEQYHLYRKMSDKLTNRSFVNVSSKNGRIGLNGNDFNDWKIFYGNPATIENECVINSNQGVRITLNDDMDEISLRNHVFKPFRIDIYDSITVLLHIENAKNIHEIEIYLAVDHTYGQYVSKNIKGKDLSDGWNEIALDKRLYHVVGNDDLSSPRKALQIRAISSNNGNEVSIVFDSIVLAKKGTAKIIFTFDDAWLSQYTNAFPIMHERGIVGNVGIVPTWIGRDDIEVGYERIMNLEELKHMHSYGWNLFNHTYSHPNLNNVTKEEAISQVIRCRDWLVENGFPEASEMLAYPYGGHINISKDKEFSNIMKYGRTLVEGLSPSLPLLNAMRGKTRNMIKGVAPSVFKSHIDEAIRTGSVLVLTNHIIDNLEEDTYGLAYPINDFTEIIDYVVSKRDEIEAITLSEWKDYIDSYQ